MKKWRKDNGERSRLEYLETKGHYRVILNRKEELYNAKQSEIINKLLKDNDTKGIWNFINKSVETNRIREGPNR